jgi:hypothetical protein
MGRKLVKKVLMSSIFCGERQSPGPGKRAGTGMRIRERGLIKIILRMKR